MAEIPLLDAQEKLLSAWAPEATEYDGVLALPPESAAVLR